MTAFALVLALPDWVRLEPRHYRWLLLLGALAAVGSYGLTEAFRSAPAAVVYLHNVKTQAVRTYIADDNGSFHFSGLDPNVDYDVHAEKDNAISPSITVSRFDSRRDIQLTLKLSKTKNG